MKMEYKRLTKLSDLGTLHALDFNGEEQPLCELTALDIDVLIRRLYELENKIESGELDVVKEAEHRAEVAVRMAKRACDIVFSQEIESEEWDEAIFNYKKEKGICEIGITPNILYDYLKEQAEKELAEESNDDKKTP